MSKIGVLTTGAGVVTTLNNEFTPEFLQIGSADVPPVLTALTVTTNGGTHFEVNTAAQIAAIAVLDSEPSIAAGGSLIPYQIKLAMGQIPKRTFINLKNAGATTPNVYGNSQGQADPRNRKIRTAVETSINANTTGIYKGFEYLLLDPTNVSKYNVVFANGWQEELDTFEMEGLFSRLFNSQESLLIGGLLPIAGYANPINGVREVKIINGSGGATTVTEMNYKTI